MSTTATKRHVRLCVSDDTSLQAKKRRRVPKYDFDMDNFKEKYGSEIHPNYTISFRLLSMNTPVQITFLVPPNMKVQHWIGKVTLIRWNHSKSIPEYEITWNKSNYFKFAGFKHCPHYDFKELPNNLFNDWQSPNGWCVLTPGVNDDAVYEDSSDDDDDDDDDFKSSSDCYSEFDCLDDDSQISNDSVTSKTTRTHTFEITSTPPTAEVIDLTHASSSSSSSSSSSALSATVVAKPHQEITALWEQFKIANEAVNEPNKKMLKAAKHSMGAKNDKLKKQKEAKQKEAKQKEAKQKEVKDKPKAPVEPTNTQEFATVIEKVSTAALILEPEVTAAAVSNEFVAEPEVTAAVSNEMVAETESIPAVVPVIPECEISWWCQ